MEHNNQISALTETILLQQQGIELLKERLNKNLRKYFGLTIHQMNYLPI